MFRQATVSEKDNVSSAKNSFVTKFDTYADELKSHVNDELLFSNKFEEYTTSVCPALDNMYNSIENDLVGSDDDGYQYLVALVGKP